MQHVVDRNPWSWQESKLTPALVWVGWALSALFCLSAAVNTGITGLTFGIPFAFVVTTMAFRGYARQATLGLLVVCAVLKFAQDDTSTLYYNGIGDELTLNGGEFCPNVGGGRPYVANRCDNPASPRLKRTLGKLTPGNYTVTEVDAEYGDLNTRYIYVVDTPYGPAQVSPTRVNVTWSDGSPVDEDKVLKDVPRWLSMLMYYPQIPLMLLRGGN